MGKYVKLTCPHCKYVLQNYTLDNTYGMIDIGEPLEICPNCKQILIKKNIKEINMMTKFDYFRMYFWNIIGGVFFVWFVVPILIIPFIAVFITDNKTVLNILYIFIVIFSSYFYVTRSRKVYKQKKIDSRNRLEDIEYRTLIENIFNLK